MEPNKPPIPLGDFKRDERSGLWIPDSTKSGLEALKEENQPIDPKKHAKGSCKFCHGTGEMRRLNPKTGQTRWNLCMCVIKKFPRGKKNTERLIEAEKDLHARKNK
jgi:hypothetical protein